MTDTDGATDQVLRTYYETIGAGAGSFDQERLRGILAPDLAFEGPIAGSHVGAEPFIKGVAGFVETARSLRVLHQLAAGDAAATLYDAEMPKGTVRFAEFIQVEGGRIKSIRLLYDPEEYRSRGGR